MYSFPSMVINAAHQVQKNVSGAKYGDSMSTGEKEVRHRNTVCSKEQAALCQNGFILRLLERARVTGNHWLVYKSRRVNNVHTKTRTKEEQS